jgi:hypothetical protein
MRVSVSSRPVLGAGFLIVGTLAMAMALQVLGTVDLTWKKTGPLSIHADEVTILLALLLSSTLVPPTFSGGGLGVPHHFGEVE